MSSDLIVSLLVMGGSLFMLLAAIGVVRMPDVYMRIGTATKAATLAAGCLLLAVAIHFATVGVVTRALAILVFIFITAPVGAHVMGRAAYIVGIPLWENTLIDELHGRYDQRTRELRSGDSTTHETDPKPS